MIVVDASAFVELLLRSPIEPSVRAAIGPEEACAPELLDAEILSSLRGLERAGKLDADRGARALRRLRTSALRRYGHGPLLVGAWALRANLSAYDALYVALARRLGCPLVTADARLARAPGLGVTVTLVGA